MNRVALAAILVGCITTAGCVTTAGLTKGDQTSKKLLFGAAAADLVVTGVIASQVEDFSAGATIATALAVTAVDVTVGCLFGACNSLRLW